MGIRGLWTYIQSNSENFSSYELHNQPLVIDAENFASLCYRQAALRCEYGGEYLAFKGYVQLFLKQFRICRVNPIFVFDGCHSKEVCFQYHSTFFLLLPTFFPVYLDLREFI